MLSILWVQEDGKARVVENGRVVGENGKVVGENGRMVGDGKEVVHVRVVVANGRGVVDG